MELTTILGRDFKGRKFSLVSGSFWGDCTNEPLTISEKDSVVERKSIFHSSSRLAYTTNFYIEMAF